jgi:hypothetical protein
MPKVKVGDINMYYEVHSKGKPFVVIAGITANVNFWFKAIPVFSKEYKLVVFDNRGAGQSDAPDVTYIIDDILVEGDKTAIRCTLRATHKGTFMGIPATGKRIAIKQVEIHKIFRGKIVEAWRFCDSQGMMNQLGIIPGIQGRQI